MIRNFSRRARQFEFALATTFIALTSWFLLDALAQLQAESEKLAVETTVRNINSGLFLQQAERMVTGRESELPILAQENPVAWLERPPTGYVGERDCTAPGVLAAAQWCWDPAGRLLYYRPLRTEGLKIDADVPWLTWRVHSPADPKAIRPGTLRVVLASPYTWNP